MKTLRIFLILVLFISFTFIGCEKTDIEPDNYFETEINSLDKKFKSVEAIIDKGITIINAQEVETNSIKTVVLTINTDEIGNFKQTFDYKTGVSISECGLSYKIISKDDESGSTFFISYEGSVSITEIDRRKKQITGSYIFKLNSIPNSEKPYIIKGKFIKLSYK